MFQPTTATKKIINLTKRLRCIQGGTSASKTISILMWLIHYAQTNKDKLASVVSESFPHLKRGAIKDFLNILQSQNYFNDDCWNKTDFIYTFPSGSQIQFFSVDQPSKVRGPRREVLFINEANNIPYEAYDQLAIRTNEVIWLDWNPVSEFWYYTEIKDRVDHDYITLTYKDNEALSPAIVQEIESRRGNKNWFKVYGEGQLGEVEGRIYTNWQIIDDIPHEARLERYGLDFGYSVDPSAIVAIYVYNGGFILDEITYQKGLSNKQLADIFHNVPKALVIADSAEPKSIDELISHGVNVLPSQKGPGSVNQGIQYVQDQRISITKRSTHLIKEQRNYLWEKEKDGVGFKKTPVGIFNHGMDAIRYGFESLQPARESLYDFETPNPWSAPIVEYGY